MQRVQIHGGTIGWVVAVRHVNRPQRHTVQHAQEMAAPISIDRPLGGPHLGADDMDVFRSIGVGGRVQTWLEVAHGTHRMLSQ